MTMSVKNLILILCSFPLLPQLLHSQSYTQTVRGVVLDKSVKTPLIGATITVLSEQKEGTSSGAVTDVEGNFRLAAIPVGKLTLRVTYLGYKEQTLHNITVNSGKEVFLTIEMEEDLLQVKEVEIRAKVDKQKPLNELATVSARTFSVEETQRFAAAVNDPARMAASFAGVVMRGDGNNTINIRGNSSNGLVWRMEGVEIPNPNHFSSLGSSGGGISVLSAQVLSNSDFLTGAFPAEYGNALSGVFDLRLRKGNTEKREYTLQAGVLGLDFATEGPLRIRNKTGSYLVNYRYSTLSLVAKLGVPLGDAVTNFQDLSFNCWMPAGKAGTFTLFGMGGLSLQTQEGKADSLAWEKDLYSQYQGKFGANTGVIGLTHSIILGNNTYLKTVIAASGTDNVDNGFLYQKDYSLRKEWEERHLQNKITVSSVLNHKWNARHLLRTGAWVSSLNYDLSQANLDATSEQLVQQVKTTGTTQTLNTFAQWQYRISPKMTLNTGLHGSMLFLNDTWSVEPRSSVKYAFSDKQSVSFGYGLHSQMQPIGVYFVQNPLNNSLLNKNLGVTRSHHYVLSFDQSLPGNLHLKTEAYYQDMRHVPVSAQGATSFSMLNLLEDFPYETLENTGRGRNYGLELTFEKYLTNGLYFLLASSWYEAKYKGSDQIWRNTRFNGKYANSLSAGKEWDWNRKNKVRTFAINLKLIQTGGLRDTPIDLVASRQQEKTVYDESRAFELQMPAYFRLDTGVRLKRNYKALTTILSLDLQNATNRRNVFGKYYDTQTFEVKYYYQAPLIPILSYKVEF